MEVIALKSLQELLNRKLWDTHTMIFRGVPDADYQLITSLGRTSINNHSALMQYEKSLLDEFVRRAQPHLRNTPDNYIDWMCLAQHYEVPTRLLDWTTSPLIAMYFATEKHPDKDFAVFKRIQNCWISGYEQVGFGQVTGISGVRPPQTDVRFVNQDGAFTLHEEPATALDDENVVKFIFPAQIKEEVHWVIRKYGIHAARIYPGLEGVAKDILQALSVQVRDGSLRTTGSPFDPW